MKSSNPVLRGLETQSSQHASFRTGGGTAIPPYAPGGYGQPGQYGQAGGYGQPGQYGQGPQAPTETRRMTVDDVVVRTVSLLAVVLVTGAASWLLLPDTGGLTTLALFGALGVGLVLGLVISFARITNPALILTYAAVQGVLLGLVSRVYEAQFSGIVLQAVIGTFAVFAGMAALYKFKVIRATPMFTKWLMGAVIGVVVLMAANFLLSVFGVNGGAGLTLRDGGPVAIIFSLVCIGVAALTFILDFAAIEDGVRMGVDQKYAWYSAFGILVGLVWLYLEILRLLGYARD